MKALKTTLARKYRSLRVRRRSAAAVPLLAGAILLIVQSTPAQQDALTIDSGGTVRIAKGLDVRGALTGDGKNLTVDGGALQQVLGSKLPAAGGAITGNLTIAGKLGIGASAPADANLDIVGTVKMFAPPQRLPKGADSWRPAKEGDSVSGVASEQDGFLSVTVKLRDRVSTVCYVEGRLNGDPMGAASVVAVSGTDWPVWENSFMMPVYKGSRWEVVFHQDEKGFPQRSSPDVYIRWTPLGR